MKLFDALKRMILVVQIRIQSMDRVWIYDMDTHMVSKYGYKVWIWISWQNMDMVATEISHIEWDGNLFLKLQVGGK